MNNESRRAAAACEPVATAVERGRIDGKPGQISWWDVDCDGVADLQFFVPRDASLPAQWMADQSGDGKIDTILLDEDRDGLIDSSIYDTNGDGRVDLRGYHRDGEFEPYRVERVR